MQKEVPNILRRLGWNRRVLSYDLFEQACEDYGILLYDALLPDGLGFYAIYPEGQEVIAIDRRLHGFKRNLVAWHEFGHSLWHHPGHYGHFDKTEFEANIIGHVALIPKTLLRSYTPGEISDLYDYPLSVVTERIRMYRLLKI